MIPIIVEPWMGPQRPKLDSRLDTKTGGELPPFLVRTNIRCRSNKKATFAFDCPIFSNSHSLCSLSLSLSLLPRLQMAPPTVNHWIRPEVRSFPLSLSLCVSTYVWEKFLGVWRPGFIDANYLWEYYILWVSSQINLRC